MKKNMIKTTGLVIMLFVAVNSFGQTTTKQADEKSQLTQVERADRNLRILTSELNLTTDQTPKVREVLLTSIKQGDLDKVAAKDDPAKLKELNSVRFKTKNESLKKILTADQHKKLEEIWKEKRQSGKAENE